MTDPLPDTNPNVSCPVCLMPPGRLCVALDGMPFPQGHAERRETTPTADAALAEVADTRPLGERLQELHGALVRLTSEVSALIGVEAHGPHVVARVCGATAFRCRCVKPPGHVDAGDDVHGCNPDECGGSWRGSEADGTMMPVTFPNPAGGPGLDAMLMAGALGGLTVRRGGIRYDMPEG